MLDRARRILTNLALTAATLAVTFALGEIVVRLLYKQETALFPRYHTDYRYGRYTIRGIRPNTEYWMTSIDGSWKTTTNSKGFRNAQEFTNPKPAGLFRVLSIGDSHTQGHEVRQDFTFSAVLERSLNRHGKRAEVINAGVSGFSTAEALVFLENEGIRYSPDVVVLGFFANDFEDNLKTELFGLDQQNRLTEEKYEHLPGVSIQNAIYSIAIVRWLSENSYFYSLLFNNVWHYFKSRPGHPAAEATSIKRRLPSAISEEIEYAIPTVATFSEYQIALAAALIERMQRFCADRGIRFVVVDIPTPVIPTPVGPDRFESSVPPALLKRLAAARVELIGSRPLLESYEGISELHLPHGARHISEFTHTLIGIEIGRRLLAPGGPGADK